MSPLPHRALSARRGDRFCGPERAFNLDNNVICILLGKNSELRTKCSQVLCRHLLIDLYGQQVDFVLVGRGFIPIPQQNKVRLHLVLERTRQQEGMVAHGAHRNPWGRRKDT